MPKKKPQLKKLDLAKVKREFTIDELIEGITPENRHDEIDWGPPVGKEIW